MTQFNTTSVAASAAASADAHARGHINRREFIGIIGLVDYPSDKSPAGARGHKILLRRAAVVEALPGLVGMGVCARVELDGHDVARGKIGVITRAWLGGKGSKKICVRGWLWQKDCAEMTMVETTKLYCVVGWE